MNKIRGHEFIKEGRSFKVIVDEKMSGYYAQNYKCQRCNQVYVDWSISDSISLCKNMKVQESIWSWIKTLSLLSKKVK